MNTPILGDQLYHITRDTSGAMFQLGRYIQLAYESFRHTAQEINKSTKKTFNLKYPIGQHASGRTMLGELEYDKDNLLQHYNHLGLDELPLTAIYHLVTFTETMLLDIIRTVVLSFPKKLSKKRKIPISTVLSCDTIESIHLAAIDSFLHELSYQSPMEFTESVREIIGCNLLDIPAYPRYIEVKATRDIFIHNKGRVNKIYVQKSSPHARGKVGDTLSVDTNYFLSAYESCFQITFELQGALHKIWHSPEYEASKNLEKNGKEK